MMAASIINTDSEETAAKQMQPWFFAIFFLGYSYLGIGYT